MSESWEGVPNPGDRQGKGLEVNYAGVGRMGQA